MPFLTCHRVIQNSGVNTVSDNRYEQLQEHHSRLPTEYQRVLEENRQLREDREKERFCYKNFDKSGISALTGLPSVPVFMWLLGHVWESSIRNWEI